MFTGRQGVGLLRALRQVSQKVLHRQPHDPVAQREGRPVQPVLRNVHQQHQPQEACSAQALGNYLSALWKGLPRTQLQKTRLVRAYSGRSGEIHVNQKKH